MAEVIASEAKLRISLDTTQAAADLKNLGVPAVGGTPAVLTPGDGGAAPGGGGGGGAAPGGGGGPGGGGTAPGSADDTPESQTRTPRRADRPYVGGPGRGNMSGRELYNKAQNAFGVVASGRLYDQTLRIARSIGTPSPGGIPIPIGPAASAVEFIRQYGAYGTGGIKALSEALGLPEPVQEAIDATLGESIKAIQDKANNAKHWSNALGSGLSAAQALAWGKAIKDEKLGLEDVADIIDFGGRVAKADVMFSEIDTRKRINFQSKMSAGIITGIAEAVKGAAGR